MVSTLSSDIFVTTQIVFVLDKYLSTSKNAAKLSSHYNCNFWMTLASYSTIVCCRWEDHKSLWREDHKSLWMLPMHPELTEVYANRGRYKFCTTSVSEQHYFNQTTCLNTSYTTNWITISLLQQSASPTVFFSFNKRLCVSNYLIELCQNV